MDVACLRPAAGKRRAESLDPLATALGPYLRLVQVVLMGDTSGQVMRQRPGAGSASDLVARLIGHLDDEIPPLPLSRYDRIRYWLARRYVFRPPPWCAIQADDVGWPSGSTGRLVLCAPSLADTATQASVRAHLDRYYWMDLWWGGEPAPQTARLRQAHALMVRWSVPRRLWPSLLGTDADEFEQRVDLLLTIHAGTQVLEHAGPKHEHWVHLPSAALEMRRPIEIIASEGVPGLERIRQAVWTPGSR